MAPLWRLLCLLETLPNIQIGDMVTLQTPQKSMIHLRFGIVTNWVAIHEIAPIWPSTKTQLGRGTESTRAAIPRMKKILKVAKQIRRYLTTEEYIQTPEADKSRTKEVSQSHEGLSSGHNSIRTVQFWVMKSQTTGPCTVHTNNPTFSQGHSAKPSHPAVNGAPKDLWLTMTLPFTD